jgi:hypothetical protein
MFNRGAVLVALAVVAVAFWQGHRIGYASAVSVHESELLAQIEAGHKLDAARRQVAFERDQLARELEEEAHADPIAVEHCLGPGRVRRLNAIR